jgi:hypothetical protein
MAFGLLPKAIAVAGQAVQPVAKLLEVRKSPSERPAIRLPWPRKLSAPRRNPSPCGAWRSEARRNDLDRRHGFSGWAARFRRVPASDRSLAARYRRLAESVQRLPAIHEHLAVKLRAMAERLGDTLKGLGELPIGCGETSMACGEAPMICGEASMACDETLTSCARLRWVLERGPRSAASRRASSVSRRTVSA